MLMEILETGPLKVRVTRDTYADPTEHAPTVSIVTSYSTNITIINSATIISGRNASLKCVAYYCYCYI